MSEQSPAAPDGTLWGKLYETHRPAMFRRAVAELRRTGRGDADAHDIAQQAFISVMKSPPSSVDCWEKYLVKATHNKVIDCYKQAEHQRTRLSPPAEDGQPQIVEPPAAEDTADIVARRLEADDVRRKLLTLINTMPPRRAEVLKARIFEGKDVGHIATDLGTSSANVSKLLKQGLEQILPSLSEFGVEADVLQNLRRTRQPGGTP